jgi:hypothetical protein
MKEADMKGEDKKREDKKEEDKKEEDKKEEKKMEKKEEKKEEEKEVEKEEEEKKKRMRSRRRRRGRSLWCGGRTHLLGGEGGQYFGRRQTQLCTLRKYFVPKGIIIPLYPLPPQQGVGGGGSGGEFSHPPPLQKIWPAGVGRGIYGG